MRERIPGAVEAAWNLFEFRHFKLHPTVQCLAIHLDGEKVFPISNPRIPQQVRNRSSTLERYFKRPSQYRSMAYLIHYENVILYDTLPRSLQSQSNTLPKNHGNPRRYIVDLGDANNIVCRIRTVSPSKVDLFAVRLILMHKSLDSYEDAKNHQCRTYDCFRSVQFLFDYILMLMSLSKHSKKPFGITQLPLN